MLKALVSGQHLVVPKSFCGEVLLSSFSSSLFCLISINTRNLENSKEFLLLIFINTRKIKRSRRKDREIRKLYREIRKSRSTIEEVHCKLKLGTYKSKKHEHLSCRTPTLSRHTSECAQTYVRHDLTFSFFLGQHINACPPP